eukprot:403374961
MRVPQLNQYIIKPKSSKNKKDKSQKNQGSAQKQKQNCLTRVIESNFENVPFMSEATSSLLKKRKMGERANSRKNSKKQSLKIKLSELLQFSELTTPSVVYSVQKRYFNINSRLAFAKKQSSTTLFQTEKIYSEEKKSQNNHLINLAETELQQNAQQNFIQLPQFRNKIVSLDMSSDKLFIRIQATESAILKQEAQISRDMKKQNDEKQKSQQQYMAAKSCPKMPMENLNSLKFTNLSGIPQKNNLQESFESLFTKNRFNSNNLEKQKIIYQQGSNPQQYILTNPLTNQSYIEDVSPSRFLSQPFRLVGEGAETPSWNLQKQNVFKSHPQPQKSSSYQLLNILTNLNQSHSSEINNNKFGILKADTIQNIEKENNEVTANSSVTSCSMGMSYNQQQQQTIFNINEYFESFSTNPLALSEQEIINMIEAEQNQNQNVSLRQLSKY